MLSATEGVDVPIDELERVGRADLERNLASLKEACGQYAPGKSLTECVAKAQTSKPEGGTVEVWQNVRSRSPSEALLGLAAGPKPASVQSSGQGARPEIASFAPPALAGF